MTAFGAGAVFVLVAIDGEGDAHAAENHLGLSQHCRARGLRVLST
jgi:hypothetical protein